MARWNAARTKIQLKLAIQRSRMLQEKKAALAKRARLDIAELVEHGKHESARVKTESLIVDDVHLELLELLELYCETLTEPDDAIREPLTAVVHAARRTELHELHVLQDMLCARYGAEFTEAALENTDGCVTNRVTRKLAFHMPPPDLVDAYLAEICKAYQVSLPGEEKALDTEVPGKDTQNEGARDRAPAPSTHDAPAVASGQDAEWHALVARFDALKKT